MTQPGKSLKYKSSFVPNQRLRIMEKAETVMTLRHSCSNAVQYRKYIVAYALLLCSASLFAQYPDHRNRKVDSLEQVLATNPPTDSRDLAIIYENLMWGYRQINTEKSMDYARKYTLIAISLDKLTDVAGGYRMVGLNFYANSQYDSATVYYGKALEAAERMRDYPQRYTEKNMDSSFSTTYGNMANLYNIQGKYREAVAYYIKALELFEKHDWKENQSNAYYNIGEMYLSMDNYGQAEIYYRKLNAIAHEVGDSRFIALANSGLSIIALHDGN
jgi:tetratricopeptide (TPR) repeat protein